MGWSYTVLQYSTLADKMLSQWAQLSQRATSNKPSTTHVDVSPQKSHEIWGFSLCWSHSVQTTLVPGKVLSFLSVVPLCVAMKPNPGSAYPAEDGSCESWFWRLRLDGYSSKVLFLSSLCLLSSMVFFKVNDPRVAEGVQRKTDTQITQTHVRTSTDIHNDICKWITHMQSLSLIHTQP